MNTKTLPRNFKGESFIKVIKLFDLLLNCHPFKTERINDHQRSTVYYGTLTTVHNCSKIKSLHSIFLPVCCSASDTPKHDYRIHTAKKTKWKRNRRERQLQIITHIQKLKLDLKNFLYLGVPSSSGGTTTTLTTADVRRRSTIWSWVRVIVATLQISTSRLPLRSPTSQAKP